MRKAFLPQKIYLLFILVALIPACQSREEVPHQAEEAPSLLPTTPAHTPSLSTPTLHAPTVTGASTSSDSNLLPSLEPHEMLSSDFANEDFQDLIIFSSHTASVAAFANFPLDIPWAEGMESHGYAFSPDGGRAGPLIPSEFASTIYLPPNSADKPMLVEYGVEFDHTAIQGIGLPQECYQPSGAGEKLIACGGFQFSPDGQYLGFFYGPPACWRGIIIQDTQSGEQVYHSEFPNGHSFSLFENGKALIATGHCEGGAIAFHNLVNGAVKPLGGEGGQSWNVDHSALAVVVGSYAGIDQSIWGFNLETEQLFLQVPEKRQIDDHPIWTPNKQFLLYQHRTFTRASDGFFPTGFDQARQVIMVDAQTGNQKILLSDPAYDFHLGSCSTCAVWYGDWIQIRRVAFTPEPIKGGDEMYSSKEFTCRMYGENCASPVEFYALNWKTGELIPWGEMVESGLVPDLNVTETPAGPGPTQQPIYERPNQYKLYAGPKENTFWVDWRYGGEGGGLILSGPDLASKPIYEHPNGLYTYFVGIDGKSLWMVPKDGIPLPWVLDGQNYFYLGKK